MSGSGGVAQRGFLDAVSRLRAWIERGDYEHPTPFAEILDHLYRIENGQRLRLGDHSYFPARDSDANGRVLGGIVYARGLTTHLDVLTTTIEGARPITFGRSKFGNGDQFGGQGVRLVWRAFKELPLPGKPERSGRDLMYQRAVAGNDVMDTLDNVAVFLVSIGALAAP